MAGEKHRVRVLSDRSSASVKPRQDGGERVPETRPLQAHDGAGETATQESRLILFESEPENRREGDCRVILRQSVFEQINKHLASDTRRELGGLLIGREFHFSESLRPVVIIDYALEAQHTEGTPASLTFSEETWSDFEQREEQLKQQRKGVKRLGWYHSHPNISIFLSHWDLDVCTNFTRPTCVALVVDPVKHLGGFFIKGKAGFRPREPQGFWLFHDLEKPSLGPWHNLPQADARWEGPTDEELDKILGSDLQISLPQITPGPGPSPNPEPSRPKPLMKVWRAAAKGSHNFKTQVTVPQVILGILLLLISGLFVVISRENTKRLDLLAGRISDSEARILSLSNEIQRVKLAEVTPSPPVNLPPSSPEPPAPQKDSRPGDVASQAGRGSLNQQTPVNARSPRSSAASKEAAGSKNTKAGANSNTAASPDPGASANPAGTGSSPAQQLGTPTTQDPPKNVVQTGAMDGNHASLPRAAAGKEQYKKRRPKRKR
ncbi:MAG: Mov34/MPN/PAD-1 family protein [Blastocatellia bacterium]